MEFLVAKSKREIENGNYSMAKSLAKAMAIAKQSSNGNRKYRIYQRGVTINAQGELKHDTDMCQVLTYRGGKNTWIRGEG